MIGSSKMSINMINKKCDDEEDKEEGRLHHITDNYFIWFILHIYCIHQDIYGIYYDLLFEHK